MSYPINYPTPQGANVQIFRGGNTSSSSGIFTRDWVKPQGASFVWFTLIGAGGGGGSGYIGAGLGYGGGGASGNVTNFMCPAFLLPDVLQVNVGKGGLGGVYPGFSTPGVNGLNGESTQIIYQQKNNTGYQLLIASAGAGGGGSIDDTTFGSGGSGQAADVGGPMTAAGFYSATSGMQGAYGSTSVTTDAVHFLLGGSGLSAGGVISGYYGYSAADNIGYGQIQPIMQSITGGKKSPFGAGGCGGQSNVNGNAGGDGLVIIVTW